MLSRKIQLRYSPVNTEDPAQLLSDTISSNSPITIIRSYNAGEYQCMHFDINNVIAQIILEIDIGPLDFYIENLPQMNDLSKILVDTVLYNGFHSSISTNVLSTKQKYILLLYVRRLIMDMYGLNEYDTIDNPLINILMAKTESQSTKTLTKKDLGGIRKLIKLNTLNGQLLSEENVNVYIENIMNCVMASYSIVNHNDPSLLGTMLVYDSNQMTSALLDMCVKLLEMFQGR